MHVCLQECEQCSVPVGVARCPALLCVAAANTLHILDVRADGLSDTTVEEPGHSGTPVVFEFSELT